MKKIAAAAAAAATIGLAGCSGDDPYWQFDEATYETTLHGIRTSPRYAEPVEQCAAIERHGLDDWQGFAAFADAAGLLNQVESLTTAENHAIAKAIYDYCTEETP